MSKGKTKSGLKLSERRELAFSLFRRGMTDPQVADRLRVNIKTARSYRRLYEESLTDEALRNPGLLRDVLKNTLRSLGETDEVRADAWASLEEKDRKIRVTCPECDHEWKITAILRPGHEVRAKYHALILRANETRAKLLGALGLKHDILMAVTEVRATQQRLMGWLMDNLLPEQREELASFLETGDTAPVDAGSIFDDMVVPIETTAVERV